ncbi:MAG TPA: SMC family ATPase [Chloroflexota bacterium]|nr:SMC family ATPase [Chloroflexota bacterium]
MIPIALRLRNFLSYGEDVPPLLFDGLHVACIIGPNGHGKSALLDAITWALWGECRARASDDVIRAGAQEAEVEFEFALDTGRYRVLRKRSRAGRSSLDLHMVQPDGLRALTGNSVRDTQQRIIDLLGMRYDTFINSAFLVQGRADEFTVKPPGERKRILAEILELQRYDEYEARARAAQREREEAIRDTQAKIAQAEAELAGRAEREAEEAGLREEARRCEGAVLEAQTTSQVLRERLSTLARAQDELRQAEQRLAEAQAELQRAERTIADHRARLQVAERVLANAAAIERGYQELLVVRAELAVLGERAGHALALQQQRVVHERAIASARAALETTLRQLDDQLRQAQRDAAERPKLAQQLQQAEAAAARHQELLEQRARVMARLAEARGEQASLEARNAELRKRFREAKEHQRVLAEADQCPYCLTPLDATSRQHAIARSEQQNRELAEQGRANNARLAALQACIAEAQAELEQLEAEIAPLTHAYERLGQWRQALEQALRAEAEQERLRQERDTAAAALERGDYAPEAQAALVALDAQLAALNYDPERHARLRKREEQLAIWEQEHARLVQMREAVPREQALLAEAEATAATWRARHHTEEALVGSLRAELAELPRLQADVEAAEAAWRRAEDARRHVQQKLGAVRQQLQYLDFLAIERQRLVQQRDQLQQEQGIYRDLALAFGKRGIQAMIIEAAIPELEAEANALLARMTDNRMHLLLETQRDTQKGTTIETLDIKLADELGTRSYELFSGGEAFRANFALRVALAKLVARRAGVPLQLLIIDEGFGTQDAEGIERIVEAIKAIQDDFQHILVVTHLAEMKEVFPARIEVRKTRQGSQFQIV